MTPARTPSRRRVLQLTGGLAMGALSGCLGFLTGSDSSAIENVTYQGEQVVVHVADDTNADAIDFRSPSDELLDTATIGRQTKVTFSLYENTATPYSPGDYTLVAVETSGDGDSQTLEKHSLTLTSSFSVADVRPIKDPGSGEPPFDGKVRITLTNTGTLPIRISYIGFPSGVPSPNRSPSQTPSPRQYYVPTSGTGHFVPVESQSTFESRFSPLWTRGGTPKEGAVGVPKQSASWQQIKNNHCNGEHHPATLVVVPEQGAPHTLTVTFEYGGTAARQDSRDTDYGCTNVSVVNSQPTNTSTPTAQ